MYGAVTAVTKSAALPGITDAPQPAWRSEHAGKKPVFLKASEWGRIESRSYYRGLNNYLYYFGGPCYIYSIMGPQNPILIVKAPILAVGPGVGNMSRPSGAVEQFCCCFLRKGQSFLHVAAGRRRFLNMFRASDCLQHAD